MNILSDNDLKTKGIAGIESELGQADEAVIRVRGMSRFVVMKVARYEHLRQAAILSAWHEARAAMARGEFVMESAAAHVACLQEDAAGQVGHSGRGRNLLSLA